MARAASGGRGPSKLSEAVLLSDSRFSYIVEGECEVRKSLVRRRGGFDALPPMMRANRCSNGT